MLRDVIKMTFPVLAPILIALLALSDVIGQCTYTGSISAADATHSNSLVTSGVNSTAGTPQACPGIFASTGTIHYDQYHFYNSSGASQTYTVTSDATGCSTFLMGSTYLTSFDPTNMCANYLASMGAGYSDLGSYEFTVADGAAFKVLVEEFDPAVYCATYTVTITPCASEGVPTASPTPTPSPSPTVSPTPTPTPTPSGLSVTGRVLTPAGLGLRNAVVSLTDSQGVRQTSTTGSFGVYSFDALTSGESYVLSISSKRYRFTARSVQIFSNTADFDFVGLE